MRRATALVEMRRTQLLKSTEGTGTWSVSAALNLFTRAVETYAEIPREPRGTREDAPIAGAYVSAVRKEAELRIQDAAANLDPKKRRDAFDMDRARWGSICSDTVVQALSRIDRVEAVAPRGDAASLLREELAKKLDVAGGIPAIADALEQQLSRTASDSLGYIAKDTRELADTARRLGLTGGQERLEQIEARALTRGAQATRDSFVKGGVGGIAHAMDVTTRARALAPTVKTVSAELPLDEAERINAAFGEIERGVVERAPDVAAQYAGSIRSAVEYFSLTVEEQMRRLVEAATHAGFVDAADPRDAISQLQEHKNHFGETDNLYVERRDPAEAVKGIGVSSAEMLLMDNWSPVMQLAKLHSYMVQYGPIRAAAIAEQFAGVWPGTEDVIDRRMGVVERAAEAGDVAVLLRYVQTPAELSRIVQAAATVLPQTVDADGFRERAERLETRIREVFAVATPTA